MKAEYAPNKLGWSLMLIQGSNHNLGEESFEQCPSSLSSLLTYSKTIRVNCYTFGAIIGFVYANKPVCQLEHVVSEAAASQGAKEILVSD